MGDVVSSSRQFAIRNGKVRLGAIWSGDTVEELIRQTTAIPGTNGTRVLVVSDEHIKAQWSMMATEGSTGLYSILLTNIV